MRNAFIAPFLNVLKCMCVFPMSLVLLPCYLRNFIISIVIALEPLQYIIYIFKVNGKKTHKYVELFLETDNVTLYIYHIT